MWDERINIARQGGMAALVDANMQRWFSPAFHRDRKTELNGFIAMFTRTPVDGYIGTGMAIRDADFRDVRQHFCANNLRRGRSRRSNLIWCATPQK